MVLEHTQRYVLGVNVMIFMIVMFLRDTHEVPLGLLLMYQPSSYQDYHVITVYLLFI